MTPEEIAALGVSTDLVTAARALGVSKSSAYAAARSGTFPVRTIRVGSRYVVPTAELKAALGLAASA
ncbi:MULTISPECIES: helix-turn-helix domain-containing protein [Gordonia]|uniref:helix-turn-helix domain-containing protein n=1 Tax=Gordonia TaxID=2053 RepID=UPI002954CB58|nr:helix-turn-helix domain-containing protein [Gordonia amicalis]MDV7101649.1 helix-turn-helix domain-containing protein [Gordonia amicalis]